VRKIPNLPSVFGPICESHFNKGYLSGELTLVCTVASYSETQLATGVAGRGLRVLPALIREGAETVRTKFCGMLLLRPLSASNPGKRPDPSTTPRAGYENRALTRDFRQQSFDYIGAEILATGE
jgi:hypothetical protein